MKKRDAWSSFHNSETLSLHPAAGNDNSKMAIIWGRER